MICARAAEQFRMCPWGQDERVCCVLHGAFLWWKLIAGSVGSSLYTPWTCSAPLLASSTRTSPWSRRWVSPGPSRKDAALDWSSGWFKPAEDIPWRHCLGLEAGPRSPWLFLWACSSKQAGICVAPLPSPPAQFPHFLPHPSAPSGRTPILSWPPWRPLAQLHVE